MEIYEKQAKIDELLDTFTDILLYEDEQGQGRNEEAVAQLVKTLSVDICNTISKVLDENYFMPRYYTLSNRLMLKEKNRKETFDGPSRIRNLINRTMDFFKNISVEDDCVKENPVLGEYCTDMRFRYYIDEFLSSALHEIIIYEANKQSAIASKTTIDAKRAQALWEDSIAEMEKITPEIQKQLQESRSVLETTKNTLDEANVKLESAKNTLGETKNMLPNLLTILGIFVAIIMAIVTVYLSVILNENAEKMVSAFFIVDTIWARGIFLLCLGLLVFDMLFVFLYWIAKISGRSLACECTYGTCEECKKTKKDKSCNMFTRVLRRYWNFMAVNMVVVVLIGVCMFFHMRNISPQQREQFINNGDVTQQVENDTSVKGEEMADKHQPVEKIQE